MDPKSPQKEGPYAMWVILAGLTAMTAVTIGALVRYPEPTAIVTALGPVTGVIGTLVGAYFGMRGSSLAQQNANAAEVARIAAATPAADTSAPATPTYPAAPTVVQYDGTGNGNGNGNGNGAAAFVEQFKAQDGAHDGELLDDDDPLTTPADDPPDDEGDDRAAHGVTS